jgi:hypothetical protein
LIAADLTGRRFEPPAALAQPRDQSVRRDGGSVVCSDRRRAPACDDVRVADDVCDRHDRTGRDAGLRHERVDLVERMTVRPAGDDLVELVGVLDARLIGGVAWIVDQLGTADRAREAREDPLAVRADRDPALVGGAVGPARRSARVLVAHPLRDDPAVDVLRESPFHEAEAALDERDVDVLADPRRVARAQCHEGTDRRVERGDLIADADPHANRRPIGVSRGVAEPAHRFSDASESRPRRVRSVLAVPADRDVHEVRAFGAKLLVAQAVLGQLPRTKILQDDVTVQRDPARRLGVAGCAQIEGDELLVAVMALEPPRRSVGREDAPAAQMIAVGRFDLDDERAEIGHQPSGRRRRDRRTKLDDTNPREGKPVLRRHER